MKTINTLPILMVFLVMTSSCLNRQFVEGRTELISISDTLINDSTIIYGYVYNIDWPEIVSHENEFEIWIENSDIRTTNNSNGNYFIKTKPGTYTIKCQSIKNEWEQLVEGLNNIELMKNKKIEIDFYIGYTIE